MGIVKKLLAPVVGLFVADVGSAAKLRFTSEQVNLFMTPQM